MDWLEEKTEKLCVYIRNLSFRKAMVAYILVISAAVWGLSYLLLALGDRHMGKTWKNGEFTFDRVSKRTAVELSA